MEEELKRFYAVNLKRSTEEHQQTKENDGKTGGEINLVGISFRSNTTVKRELRAKKRWM